MALKPVTLRLDEEEYEKLRAHLSKFGDPDINVAYVLRAYIRDVNRVMPFLVSSGWDLKNYFGLVGAWLKQIGSVTEMEMFAKLPMNPWTFWNATEFKIGQSKNAASSAINAEPFDEKDRPDNLNVEDHG